MAKEGTVGKTKLWVNEATEKHTNTHTTKESMMYCISSVCVL